MHVCSHESHVQGQLCKLCDKKTDLKLSARRLLVQAVAADVAEETRCRLFSTERTTALLRMSALKASYQALRMTSSRRASEEPARPELLAAG